MFVKNFGGMHGRDVHILTEIVKVTTNNSK